MLCAPALHGLVANVADHGGGPRMGAPKEWAARLGLVRAGKLEGVVGRRRPEPVPPLRLTVVAVRAGSARTSTPSCRTSNERASA